jgi:HlyD family secretion protein
MNMRILSIVAGLGIIIGIVGVFFSNRTPTPLPPVTVNYNPYEHGIYTTGIVESKQLTGENINIFPQVSGAITKVFVQDGKHIKKGEPILTLDDSVQKEIVERDAAQIRYAQVSLFNLQQQLNKTKRSYTLDAKSVSKNSLDNAINAVAIQKENLNIAVKTYDADKAELDRYTLTAPEDGVILRIGVAVGDYGSPQGRYDANTQGMLPLVEMGEIEPYMEVRCFLNEILVPSLPQSKKLTASMFVRGVTNKGIALEFVKIQPFLIPKVELSNQRTEHIDTRVLPIIFKFQKPNDMNIFPGQLVDVYIRGT